MKEKKRNFKKESTIFFILFTLICKRLFIFLEPLQTATPIPLKLITLLRLRITTLKHMWSFLYFLLG